MELIYSYRDKYDQEKKKNKDLETKLSNLQSSGKKADDRMLEELVGEAGLLSSKERRELESKVSLLQAEVSSLSHQVNEQRSTSGLLESARLQQERDDDTVLHKERVGCLEIKVRQLEKMVETLKVVETQHLNQKEIFAVKLKAKAIVSSESSWKERWRDEGGRAMTSS